MTARKLHFATAAVENADNAGHGAARAVLCDQQPRQGATLWATAITNDVECAKCLAKLDAQNREVVAEITEAIELAEPEVAPVVEIATKRERKPRATAPADLIDSKEQKLAVRAFNSGVNYARNAARYGDADKALARYTKRRERQGNAATQSELTSFADGYAHEAQRIAK